MIRTDSTNGFKLAAIDLDGTLLGADHQISAANVLAVQRLQAQGAQVVLASGRHYNSMKKFAEALPGVQWIISCQGGESSDVRRETVLGRTFLPIVQAQEVLELGRSLGFTPVGYTVEGVFTDVPWNPELEFYAELAGHRPVVLGPSELLSQEVFKVIWMGEPEAISGIGLRLGQLPPPVHTVRTHARFLEFMPASVSKGTALATLVGHLGIDRSDAVAFGDGENDIPMFEWAGTSVAMPHGWPAAISKAACVAPDGPVETALACGVEMVLRNRASESPECSGQLCGEHG